MKYPNKSMDLIVIIDEESTRYVYVIVSAGYVVKSNCLIQGPRLLHEVGDMNVIIGCRKNKKNGGKI